MTTNFISCITVRTVPVQEAQVREGSKGIVLWDGDMSYIPVLWCRWGVADQDMATVSTFLLCTCTGGEGGVCLRKKEYGINYCAPAQYK